MAILRPKLKPKVRPKKKCNTKSPKKEVLINVNELVNLPVKDTPPKKPQPKSPVQADIKEEAEEEKFRKDKEYNLNLIRMAMVKLIARDHGKGGMPTYLQLSRETKLSVQTIFRHMREIEFKPQKSRYRALTDVVHIYLWEAIKDGSIQAIKLWYQVFEGWVEKTKQDIKHIGLDVDESIDPDDAKAVYLSKLNPK